MTFKKCPQCSNSLLVTADTCTKCGYNFLPEKLFHHKKSMGKSYSYVHEDYRPKASYWQNVKLIAELVLKRRGPIYTASQSTISEKLSPDRVVRKNKYLLLAFLAVIIGVALDALNGGISSSSVFLVTLSLGIIPVAAYFIWLESNERTVREPFWMLVLAFAWGILAAPLIAGLIYAFVFPDSLFCPGGISNPTGICWIGYAGFVEEPAKILGVFLIANSKRFSKQFDDHLDGLIIGAVTGLAFGFAENFGYIAMGPSGAALTQVNFGVMAENLLFARAYTPLLHMFCTGLIGWWMGYLKVNGKPITLKTIFPALSISIIIHALWDTWASLPTPALRAFQALIDPTGIIETAAMVGFSIYFVYLMNKMAKEALHDEYYWGMSKGYVSLAVKGSESRKS